MESSYIWGWGVMTRQDMWEASRAADIILLLDYAVVTWVFPFVRIHWIVRIYWAINDLHTYVLLQKHIYLKQKRKTNSSWSLIWKMWILMMCIILNLLFYLFIQYIFIQHLKNHIVRIFPLLLNILWNLFLMTA